MEAAHSTFLCTRVTVGQAEAMPRRFPAVVSNSLGRTGWLPAPDRVPLGGGVLLVVAALLGMLHSCAAVVMVVNIDNGFGIAMPAVGLLQSRTGMNS